MRSAKPSAHNTKHKRFHRLMFSNAENFHPKRLCSSNPEHFKCKPLASRRFHNTLFLSALLLLALPAHVFGSDQGGPWVFSAGYAYYTGFEDIRSTYKKNAIASGARHDVVQWSFGLTLQAHRRGHRSNHVPAQRCRSCPGTGLCFGYRILFSGLDPLPLYSSGRFISHNQRGLSEAFPAGCAGRPGDRVFCPKIPSPDRGSRL